MQYLGGKAKLAKIIVKELEPLLEGVKHFYEPFVGGFNIVPELIKFRPDMEFHCSDLAVVVSLYKAIKEGTFIPPESVSEYEYEQAKKLDDENPLKAFIGFGCSFGGKYFGGYAKNNRNENYTKFASNSLFRKTPAIKRCNFIKLDYTKIQVMPKSLIYCDPPYKNTTGYKYGVAFNHDAFWDWCRQKADEGHTVVVSEKSAPKDIEVIRRLEKNNDIRTKEGSDKTTKQVEFLFVIRGKAR